MTPSASVLHLPIRFVPVALPASPPVSLREILVGQIVLVGRSRSRCFNGITCHMFGIFRELILLLLHLPYWTEFDVEVPQESSFRIFTPPGKRRLRSSHP